MSDHRETETLPPLEILRQVEHKYLHCETYADSGTIETIDTKGNPIFLSFKTWFVRPGHYRYEWQDWSPARSKTEEFSVLNWQGNEAHVKHLWNVKERESESSGDLSRALAGATGCSAGAAGVIPTLLMSHVRAQSILSLFSASLSLDEMPGLGETYTINGTLVKTRHECKLRISKDFRLLKAEIYYGALAGRDFFSNFYYENVRFDEEIPLSRFKMPTGA